MKTIKKLLLFTAFIALSVMSLSAQSRVSAFSSPDPIDTDTKVLIKIGRRAYTVTAGELQTFVGGGGGGSTDNQARVVNFGNVTTDGSGQPVDVAGRVNNLPLFTLADNEYLLLTGITYPADRSPVSFLKTFVVQNNAAGTYGIGGTNQLLNSDLFSIETQQLTFFPTFTPITNDPNAVVEDLGEIGSTDILTIINAANPSYVIADPANWYFEYTNLGSRVLYGFAGSDGTYGAGQTQFVQNDLFLVYNESENFIPNTSGQLVKLTENGKDFHALNSIDPDTRGDRGASALDLGFSDAPSTTFGPTGDFSIDLGYNNTLSGYGGFGLGDNNNSNTTYSVFLGSNNQDLAGASGGWNVTAGFFNTHLFGTGNTFGGTLLGFRNTNSAAFTLTNGNGAKNNAVGGLTSGLAVVSPNTHGAVVLGTANVPFSDDGFNSVSGISLAVGNGTVSLPNGSSGEWVPNVTSNNFELYRDGVALLPSTDILDITNPKSIVTLEKMTADIAAASSGGGGVTGAGVANELAYWDSTSSQTSTSALSLELITTFLARMHLGVEDTTAGILRLYGASSNAANAQIELYNTALADTNVDKWNLSATIGGDFTISANGAPRITVQDDTGLTIIPQGLQVSTLNLTGLPVFADDVAAAALLTGDVYRTATGELRIKL